MKWGIRRYQNADRSLTDAGKARYYKKSGEFSRYGYKHALKDAKELETKASGKSSSRKEAKTYDYLTQLRNKYSDASFHQDFDQTTVKKKLGKSEALSL